jgi:hypothetical protein
MLIREASKNLAPVNRVKPVQQQLQFISILNLIVDFTPFLSGVARDLLYFQDYSNIRWGYGGLARVMP